jgi:uncharacterized membrane protein YesL
MLVVLLAAPLAGLHRMAALLAREQPASFGDFVEGTREFALAAIAIALGAAIVGLVLVTNAVVGFGSDGPVGWFLGATAVYGLVALALALVTVWPLLVDPDRAGVPLRRKLQLAGLVIVGRPGRLLVLGLVIVAVLGISTLLLAGVVLFGVAYACLLGTRWVLPTADELEARYEAARAR